MPGILADNENITEPLDLLSVNFILNQNIEIYLEKLLGRLL